jgi:hypothetical protein
VLVTHFFAVALFAVSRALLPLPTPTRLRQGYDVSQAETAIQPARGTTRASHYTALTKLFPASSQMRRRAPSAQLMHVACIIIMPLLAAEKVTFLSWGVVGSFVNLLFPWKGAMVE